MKFKFFIGFVFIFLIILSMVTFFDFDSYGNYSNQWYEEFTEVDSHNFNVVWNNFDDDSQESFFHVYDYNYDYYDNLRNSFVHAEREYLLGKLSNDKERMCASLDLYYDSIDLFDNPEMIYEIIFFVSKQCDKDFGSIEDKLLNHSMESKRKIYSAIINNESFSVKSYNLDDVDRDFTSFNNSNIVFGNNSVTFDDNSNLGFQVERVVRDWISYNVYNWIDYYDILDYGEGYFLNDFIGNSSLELTPLTSSIIIESNNQWYGHDEKGIFRFEVLNDKGNYPTNKCYGNVCLVLDTHGISQIVAQAIDEEVSHVFACGDSEGKMAAAHYLSKKGIDVIFPADRFLGELLGTNTKGDLIGTSPVREGKIGGQEIEVSINETILVQDNYERYPGQYYGTAKRYFEVLENNTDLNLKYFISNFNETNKLVNYAKENGYDVIAVRVHTETDYKSVNKWLDNDENRKALFFHSSIYPYVNDLFLDYPNQTSFGSV